ncbi:MAG: hypothetical protein FWC89_03890 [Defluviitaleaceae bacterium]|nr:hypothetical protein [Defluviitaleaceae bacterium]
MGHTSDETSDILKKNCEKIECYLKKNEVQLFTKYLLLTLEYGQKNDLEKLYAVNTVDDSLFCEYANGERTYIYAMSLFELESKIKDYERNNGLLSMFHNHPDSWPPSWTDLDVFVRNTFVKTLRYVDITVVFTLFKNQEYF